MSNVDVITEVKNEQGLVIFRSYLTGWYQKWEYDDKGNKTYHEYSDGTWEKWEYNAANQKTRFEHSDGEWQRWEYDEKGLQTLFETKKFARLERREYNEQGLTTRVENSNGNWWGYTYNEQGLITKYDSHSGVWKKVAYGPHGVLSYIVSYNQLGIYRRNDSGVVIESLHIFDKDQSILERRRFDEKGMLATTEKLYKSTHTWELVYDASGDLVDITICAITPLDFSVKIKEEN